MTCIRRAVLHIRPVRNLSLIHIYHSVSLLYQADVDIARQLAKKIINGDIFDAQEYYDEEIDVYKRQAFTVFNSLSILLSSTLPDESCSLYSARLLL